MEACRAYKESLLLDVYGELGFKERAEWERHLEGCPSCREERRKMLLFLDRIQQSTQAPELSPERAEALSHALQARAPGRETNSRRWERMVPFAPARALAAVTAACFLVVISGWLALTWFERPASGPDISGEIQLTQRELEVIRNLELLEELETLRKLVHAIDHNDAMSRSPQI